MDVKVVIGGRCAVEREWVGEGIRWSLRSLSVSPLQYGLREALLPGSRDVFWAAVEVLTVLP